MTPTMIKGDSENIMITGIVIIFASAHSDQSLLFLLYIQAVYEL